MNQLQIECDGLVLQKYVRIIARWMAWNDNYDSRGAVHGYIKEKESEK